MISLKYAIICGIRMLEKGGRVTPFTIMDGIITSEETELLEKVRRLLENFPEMKLFRDGKEYLISCHHLARAIGSIFGLAAKDGYFGRVGVEHSWILLPPHKMAQEGNILDVYPVGQAGGPMIVAGSSHSPWRKLYIEAPLPRLDEEVFKFHLGIILKVMKKNAEILKIVPAAA